MERAQKVQDGTLPFEKCLAHGKLVSPPELFAGCFGFVLSVVRSKVQ